MGRGCEKQRGGCLVEKGIKGSLTSTEEIAEIRRPLSWLLPDENRGLRLCMLEL